MIKEEPAFEIHLLAAPSNPGEPSLCPTKHMTRTLVLLPYLLAALLLVAGWHCSWSRYAGIPWHLIHAWQDTVRDSVVVRLEVRSSDIVYPLHDPRRLVLPENGGSVPE